MSANSMSVKAVSPVTDRGPATAGGADLLGDTLQELRKEVNQLATEDLSAVAQSLGAYLEKKVAQDPYQTLALAAGLGFGLHGLERDHLKRAAIRVGKLVAMKAISDLEDGAGASSDDDTDDTDNSVGSDDSIGDADETTQAEASVPTERTQSNQPTFKGESHDSAK